MSDGDKLIKKMTMQENYPHPLSKSEEALTLEKIKNGDESAKETLINHNLRLVAHIAKKFMHYENIDDLISIGNFGLIKAVRSFNPDKGTKFATYASRCIENEILMHLRKLKKITEKEISLDKNLPGSKDEDTGLTILDTLYVIGENDVFNYVDLSIQGDKIKQIMKKVLNKKEYAVIYYKFGFYDGIPRTQYEIAKIMNYSRTYISRLHTSAITKLKDYVQNHRNKCNS